MTELGRDQHEYGAGNLMVQTRDHGAIARGSCVDMRLEQTFASRSTVVTRWTLARDREMLCPDAPRYGCVCMCADIKKS